MNHSALQHSDSTTKLTFQTLWKYEVIAGYISDVAHLGFSTINQDVKLSKKKLAGQQADTRA